MNIYFKGGDKATNLSELLLLGFTHLADNSWYKFVKTYLDPECTIQQCHPARRSLDDLVLIANTYFPGITDKDVVKALNETKFKLTVYIMHCYDIDKPVIMLYTHSAIINVSANIIYSQGYTKDGLKRKGKSAYSMQDIIDLIEPVNELESLLVEA